MLQPKKVRSDALGSAPPEAVIAPIQLRATRRQDALIGTPDPDIWAHPQRASAINALRLIAADMEKQ
jgi:hypothetical protein